jgi:hypothetical protein
MFCLQVALGCATTHTHSTSASPPKASSTQLRRALRRDKFRQSHHIADHPHRVHASLQPPKECRDRAISSAPSGVESRKRTDSRISIMEPASASGRSFGNQGYVSVAAAYGTQESIDTRISTSTRTDQSVTVFCSPRVAYSTQMPLSLQS